MIYVQEILMEHRPEFETSEERFGNLYDLFDPGVAGELHIQIARIFVRKTTY